ncbi:Mitochondrial intermembrane space cysteine motif-containing protein MIX17 [Wickerhamiella sorbophila]|uniref:Mitochondrial intermembrane space cysteine motif-containing protein MIX17 n=1 Tax=Wickerhamiella sorbophila TaxID=45607 RepID=A0A2T0FMR3_9ASCO|nr:Mitochondrial intermembrane space cysteine motif-containing protein MIX17 [Wickerhamiella sorbophila]PRT56293.1 Mitochondrial intermembrane space cysteine motif-containing protein MIX17 [Wickerhamiella sorbophila]
MPRSRGRSAPAPRQQTRSNHTMAAPAPHQAAPQHVPVQQQRQPGMFAQMASTAAGVAVGSAVGHTLANGVSSMFGSSAPAEAPAQQQYAPPAEQQGKCEIDARNLTQCMDQNNGDMRVCQWYMDQLKACLGTSSSY